MPDMERPTDHASATEPWWRFAMIYQVYIRNFADGSGDGVADLGVDALWVNPWYPSQMKDAGYDVPDYRTIEPVLGTLDEADELIQEAHDRGL